jgi:ribonuclease J
MPELNTTPTIEPNNFCFIPLGGSEQFGVNFNLYHYKGKYIAFDCGIGFADHQYPNVDILLPDPVFIESRKENLVGLIVTHAHEDHIGAVPYLWDRLRCPVYCTKFTASVLREKLYDHPKSQDMPIIEIEAGKMIALDPFILHFLSVSHSVPESIATVIETDVGRVLHSGDWNQDPTPVLGNRTEPTTFEKVGKAGLLAYVGDSTNAPSTGRSQSEEEVEIGLTSLFKEQTGRIAITIFASNIARIQSIAHAADAAGRSVCVIGRSLHRMIGCAKNCGYLKDIQEFVQESDLKFVPADKLVVIATGSQGEAMAALSRLSRGEWSDIRMGRGDTVIFSSRAIPGNEAEINAVKNNFCGAGVKVIDPDNTPHMIHVSGHPYADDIHDMLTWTKPQIVIPVHGERVMLEAHADIARALKVPHVIVPSNGAVIKLAPDIPSIIDHVETGLLAVEPKRVLKANNKSIHERRKLQFSGAVMISLALTANNTLLMDPQITLMGLADEGEDQKLTKDLIKIIEDTLESADDKIVQLDEFIRASCRRHLTQIFGFKPKVSVHILRV